VVEGGVAGEQDPGGAEGEGICECLEYGFVQSEEAAQEGGRGGARVMGGEGIEMTTMTYEDNNCGYDGMAWMGIWEFKRVSARSGNEGHGMAAPGNVDGSSLAG